MKELENYQESLQKLVSYKNDKEQFRSLIDSLYDYLNQIHKQQEFCSCFFYESFDMLLEDVKICKDILNYKYTKYYQAQVQKRVHENNNNIIIGQICCSEEMTLIIGKQKQEIIQIVTLLE